MEDSKEEKEVALQVQESVEGKDYLALQTYELLEEFGQGRHIPGSGSAAALSGLLALQLMRTVLQISLKKEAYKAHWDSFTHILNILTNEYKPKLIDLFNGDIQEFSKVSDLRQLRNAAESPERKEKYSSQEYEQMKIVTDIPLEICELSYRMTEYAISIFDNGFKSAQGDSGVAISNLLSAMSGSLFVIFLNLKKIKKSAWKTERMNKAVDLAKKYSDIQKKAFQRVVNMYNDNNKEGEHPQLLIDFDSEGKNN